MSVQESKFTAEARILPTWAWALATLVFVGVQVGIHLLFAFHEPNPPLLPLRILFGLLPASFLALAVLGAGWVNGDAKRRGMNSTLWTLVVIFVPNALGFVLYFLLRDPRRDPCPRCGAPVQASFSYCPACAFQIKTICASCKGALGRADAFCPHCGQAATSAAAEPAT